MTRKEAIARIKDHIEIHRYHERNAVKIFEALDMAIKSLEQLEQRWIPCSERLPEVEELVLVTDDSGGIKTVDVDRCGQYENSNERFWYYTQNAVAWMPLPEPYRKEGETE